MKHTALIPVTAATLALSLPLGPLAGPGGGGQGPRWRGGRGVDGAGAVASRGAACAPGECATPLEGEGKGTLTDKERGHLLAMREEERAARDLYAVFHASYGLRIFENIGASEVRHMAAIKGLLDAYGLDDPSDGREPGSFADARLQEAYDQLVLLGGKSLADALEAGARFEELDIADLQKALADTERTDLERVFGNLQRGSRNHLRAFTRQLENRGVARTARHLEPGTLQAILDGEHERGGHQGMADARSARAGPGR